MPRIIRRPAAERDLIDIYRYIAADAPLNAATFLRRLDGKIRLLADAPGIGSARLPNYPDVRLFPVGNYLILYQPLSGGDGIELIRVFHAARDWLVLLEEEFPSTDPDREAVLDQLAEEAQREGMGYSVPDDDKPTE